MTKLYQIFYTKNEYEYFITKNLFTERSEIKRLKNMNRFYTIKLIKNCSN